MLYRGVTATRMGVMAQGWPTDGRFAALRMTLHQELAKADLLVGPEAGQPRDLFHASLLVLTGPLADPVGLASMIDGRRSTPFGETSAAAVDIARYERTASDVALTVLERIELS